MSEKFVDRCDDLAAIEHGIKNKFNWKWLEEKDKVGVFLSDYIRKTKEPGCVWCLWCKDSIKYAAAGKKAISNHSTTKKHKKAMANVKGAQELPVLFRATTELLAGMSMADLHIITHLPPIVNENKVLIL